MVRASSMPGNMHRVCARIAALAITAVELAGCVSATSVPNSPFLTALVRLNPAATTDAAAAAPNSTGSVANANAAITDGWTLRPSTSESSAGSGTQRSNPSAAAAGVETTSSVGSVGERKDVYHQVTSASGDLAAIAAPSVTQMSKPSQGQVPKVGAKARGILIGEAVGAAVLGHPLMGAQAARVPGSLADVRTAQGAEKPQVQVYGGTGGSYLGSYVNYPRQFGDVAVPGSSRTDAGIT